MFRFFVNPLGVALNFGMQDLSDLHPVTLEALLERCWNHRVRPAALPPVPGAPPLGHPWRRSDVPGRLDVLLNGVLTGAAAQQPTPGGPLFDVGALDAAIQNRPPPAAALQPGGIQRLQGGIQWHQLIYAYMVENTGLIPVFRRLAEACLHGERLGALTPRSQRWLWTTEELFLRDPPSFSISTITSSARASTADTRANAYHRLYGMPLNSAGTGKPTFPVAEHANSDFVMALDEFLYEAWQGRQNFANAAGARPTDDAKIAELATRLCDMFRSRRTNGTLSREEFVAVSTMSWFHATLDVDHSIVVDLRAEANSAEERLFKIAQRVSVPVHGLSKSYFEIAEPISRILVAIEMGTYNNPAAVPALYTPAVGGPFADMDTIMTHWSLIRGRDVKAKKLAA